MRVHRWVAVAALVMFGCTTTQLAAQEASPPVIQRLEVHPTTAQLTGPRDSLQLVVTGYLEQGQAIDLTREATYGAVDAAVADVVHGRVSPLADGTTQIEITYAGQVLSVPVVVQRWSVPKPVSFHYETLAAISKQGCNSGACHGSPSGKGGFRLSLRAFDPVLDELTLIREEFGRRTNVLQPERSLLLMKPLMKVPHGGGKQLHAQDLSYELLRAWIAEGCQVDAGDRPRCERIEVYPAERLLKHRAANQQLSVLAHFSDGTIRDITRLAVYSSSNEEVAEVDQQGWVQGRDRGDAAVLVRYLEFVESSNLTFVKDIEGFAWTDPPAGNYVDQLVHEKLKQLQYLPSEVCTDEEFIRRVYLDLIGVLPTVDELRTFSQDSTADKRARLIDHLLERPEHAKFWALRWGDLLRMTKSQVGDQGIYKYHRWLEQAFAENMPYDQFARELLTASGSTLEHPPAHFYRTAADANDCVETVSQVFLGARLQCAKCHNHPFERWTQDNYYGMAAFFNRIQRQTTRRPDEMLIWMARSGEVTQPRTGQTMKPWLPQAGTVEDEQNLDRRQTFSDWLSAPDNPYFARIEVNRIWTFLLGRGIVDPPDDFRDSNPPVNAALLDALARDFVEHGFDRRHILRTITNSHTYQASFRANPFNADDTRYFSHYQPRLLSAEQLLDAICHVTQIEESFANLPAAMKATQLPAPDLVDNEFLKTFGQPERQTVCQCERSDQSNLSMAIQCFNGPVIYDKLRHQQNRFRRLVDQSADDQQIVHQLYLAAVARAPDPAEQQAALNHIASKREAIAAANAAVQQQIQQHRAAVEQLRGQRRKALFEARLAAVPESIRADTQQALATPPADRDAVQKYLAGKLGPQLEITEADVDAALDEAEKAKVAGHLEQITALEQQHRPLDADRIVALEDVCWAILNTNEFLFQH